MTSPTLSPYHQSPRPRPPPQPPIPLPRLSPHRLLRGGPYHHGVVRISSLAYVHMPRSSVPTSNLPYISLTPPRPTSRCTQLYYSLMTPSTRYLLGRPTPIPIPLYQHTVARALCPQAVLLQTLIHSTRPSYIDRCQYHLPHQFHRRKLAPHSCSPLRTLREPPDTLRRTFSHILLRNQSCHICQIRSGPL
jgi:hypothetical protein